jgi:hypothetical protein
MSASGYLRHRLRKVCSAFAIRRYSKKLTSRKLVEEAVISERLRTFVPCFAGKYSEIPQSSGLEIAKSPWISSKIQCLTKRFPAVEAGKICQQTGNPRAHNSEPIDVSPGRDNRFATGQRYRVTRVSVQIQRALTTKTKPASDSALSMSMFYKIVLALIVIAKSVEMADARKLRYQQKAERV